MKTASFLLIGAAMLFVSCSNGNESHPTAPSAVELQAEQNKQILAGLPATLLKQIPENEQAELRAGQLSIWYLQGQGGPPDHGGLCAPLLNVSLTGAGVGTHIGRFTEVQSHCLNPATFEFTDGFAAFTSDKSGDQLSMAYRGVLVPTSDPIMLKIEGNTSLAGGTGKFDGATGEGIARGFLNVTNGEAQLVGVGSMHLQD